MTKIPDWDGVFLRSFLGLTAPYYEVVVWVNTTLRLGPIALKGDWPTAPYRASVWRRVDDRG